MYQSYDEATYNKFGRTKLTEETEKNKVPLNWVNDKDGYVFTELQKCHDMILEK
jgi:hypothetical protein